MPFSRFPIKTLAATVAAGVMLTAQLAPGYAAAPAQVVSSGTPEVDQRQSPTGARHGHPSKVVFHRTRNQAGLGSNGGNLTYHGGPTERTTSINYAIFWQPSGSYMSPTYQSLIERYFADVGGSGLYNNNTQYYDGSGNIANSSSFGGAWVDTSPYPSGTLSDSDFQNEVVNAINANAWPWTNSDTEYFVFTAKGENSCIGSSCSFTQYCAYHSNVTLTNGVTTTPVRYANMPYTGTNLSACGVSTSPNNDIDADSTINVTSHEHMETVTDPLGTSWYDATGSEIGDKCAWNFGSVSLDGNKANEEWNGHYYIVQQEWSNASSGCVLSYGSNTSPSYTIAASPSSLTALAGGSAVTSTLTLTSVNGFNNSVNLTASSSPALPAGSTLNVTTPVAVSSGTPGSSTLRVQVPAGASAGSYTLTVTGDGATPAPAAKVTLNIQGPTPTFSMSASPTSLTIIRGSSGSDTITLTSANGYNFSVSLNASGLPNRASAGFTPNPVTPTSDGATSTMRISTTPRTQRGTYTVTVSGKGPDGTAQSTTISVRVQ
jgi:hypothetical protein